MSSSRSLSKGGNSPLMMAAWKGHVEVARLLMDRGAEVDKKSQGGSTPLKAAAQMGHVEVARLLLDRGANHMAKNQYGSTPLMEAATMGHVEVARLLIVRGAEVEATDKTGKTPLMIARERGFQDMVTLLATTQTETLQEIDVPSSEAAVANLAVRSIPAEYSCSVSRAIMVDPVMAFDGQVYEKCIDDWFHINSAIVGILLCFSFFRWCRRALRPKVAVLVNDPAGSLSVAVPPSQEVLELSPTSQEAADSPTVSFFSCRMAEITPIPPTTVAPSSLNLSAWQPTTGATLSSPSSLHGVPSEYICPLSHDIMVDPVMTTNGQTYERAFIQEWLRLHDTDPLTNEVIMMSVLTPNWALKSLIDRFNSELLVRQ